MASIAALGLHIVDILARPVPKRESENILIVEEMAMTVAGTAAAPALTLGKLGAQVATFGVVGDDQLGTFLVETMRAAGVDVSSLVRRHGVPTSTSILTIRPDGSRPGMHVIGATETLTVESIDCDRLFSHDILLLGGLGLMPQLDGLPAAGILREAQARGVITALDTILRGTDADFDAVKPALRHTDYFFPNDEDALRLTGQSTVEGAIGVLRDWGVKTVVVTRGAAGASVGITDGRIVDVPTFPVEVVDTTGCGDAFAAGFLCALAEGKAIEDCVRWGLTCGSLTATRLGSTAGVRDRDQVQAATRRDLTGSDPAVTAAN